MKNRLAVILVMLLGYNVYAQQTDCKVNIPNLAGSYTGACKNGYANGKGIAQGVDHYEGQFNKGMPEGKGIYKWADGSYYDGQWRAGMREGRGKMVKADSVLNGYWKENIFQGEKEKPVYKVSVSRNIPRFSINKSITAGNGIRMKMLLGGRDNSEIEDFSIVYSSGTEYRNIGTYGIQNSSVPLEVTARYHTWNMLHTVQVEVLFEFTILEPGTWDITLNNY